jgi:DNA-binding MarR family transcriptional regulator
MNKSKQIEKGFTSIDIDMIDEIDRYIHEPSRLKILAHLYHLELTDYTYLKNLTNFSWGKLSTHLDKLEEAGYIKLEKKFVKRIKHGKEIAKTFIFLTKNGKEAFENYRSSMKQLLS